jgi:predicted ATPase
VATALGLRQPEGMSIADALAERLSRQQLLLVLDNGEHVLDAAAQLSAALLLAADDIRILATSREPLGLPEEARYRLPPLTLPDRDAPERAPQAEAVTLFVDRARQLNPNFVVDGDSAAAVARLVQRLDGMPLAIELAAARVEALGLAQLLDRLDDRFRLLISANRTAAVRQRSLEAAVDWSYQLLTVSEQRVFRRLSVFPGPFTLDAAEAVAGTEAGPVVLHLVDCSLLVPPTTGPDGRSRYLMLETLRAYGLNRLRDAGEEHDAAAALAVHALIVAEHAATQMTVRDGELPAARWLDAEDAAVHEGLAWALDHDPPVALRLAAALAPWWLVRGRWIQGHGLLQRAVEQVGPAADAWYSANISLCHFAYKVSNYGPSLDHCTVVVEALGNGPPSRDLVDGLAERCLALASVGRLAEATIVGHPAGEARALVGLAVISVYSDDGEQAADWVRQAQRIDQDEMPGWLLRQVRRAVLFTAVATGHYADDTADLCARALAQARAVGDQSEEVAILLLMAMLITAVRSASTCANAASAASTAAARAPPVFR